MNELTKRQTTEREYYNKISQEKIDKGEGIKDEDLIFKDPPSFCNCHSDLFFGAMDLFSDLKGKRILEVGCGSGEIALWLARQKEALVEACDVSDESIRIAQRRKKVNQEEKVNYHVCPAEKLDFEDNYFDFVFGNVTLHHFEVKSALEEIKRVLKPGGRAIFVEPIAFSYFLQKIRASKMVTNFVPIRQETPDEVIFTKRDVDKMREVMPVKMLPYRLITSFLRFGPIYNYFAHKFKDEFKPEDSWSTQQAEEERRKFVFKKVEELDQKYLQKWPKLAVLSRYMVLEFIKE